MPRWPWIERKFNFDYPATKFPDLLERARGTPARVEDRLRGLPAAVLTRSDGRGWSIQENVGHLITTEELARRRIEQLLSGEAELVAADMSNRATNRADYNAADLNDLLATLRRERMEIVGRLEALKEPDWSRSALHPRLRQPMRLVDLVYFFAEHDDYHLGRISELILNMR